MKKEVLVVSCLVVAFSAVAIAAEGGSITVEIAPMRSETGVVHCNLWKSAEGFPQEYKKAAVAVDAPSIAGKSARCSFTGIGPGTYAISVFHDEDGDGVLKKNVLGIPKEPLGFSNNASATFGPPSYDEAKFSFDGKALKLAITPK